LFTAFVFVLLCFIVPLIAQDAEADVPIAIVTSPRTELGLNGTSVGRRLGLNQSAVSRAVQRGQTIATEFKYLL
jgi:hypothetical protein